MNWKIVKADETGTEYYEFSGQVQTFGMAGPITFSQMPITVKHWLSDDLGPKTAEPEPGRFQNLDWEKS